MNDIIQLAAERVKRVESLDELWRNYVEAEAKAKQSLSIDDGIRAGKAWAAWLDLFVGRRA